MLRTITFLAVLAIASTSAPPRYHASTHRMVKAADDTGRLSGTILPKSYSIELTFQEDFATTLKFTGLATISLDFTTDISSENLFHAKGLTFTDITLKSGSTVLDVEFSDPDPVTDLVKLTSSTPLAAGTYSLVINYEGPINNKTMVGVYLSSYIDPFNHVKYVVATQFEDIHARKAFPCLDEPELKAPITLRLYYPVGYHVWSNTNGGSPSTSNNLETVRFLSTPAMSTYLLAFVIAEFNCKKASPTLNNKPVELCSRISAFDQSAKLALDNAPLLLDFMGAFVGFNYSVNKMTLAAIPDFRPGAMENWGLVTFREADILWDDIQSSDSYKQTVVTVLAHELSHQWFGDLVTLDWWSDLFLNEGFATFFQYFAADSLFPEWELPKQFVVEQLQPALASDSLDDVLPLSYDAADPDYSTRTNDVSYEKGASILRMLQHFLGDNLQLGLKDYINNNQLKTVTPDILWASIDPYVENLEGVERPPADLKTVMDSWITKPGYPLLTVKIDGADVVISQEQFVLSGDPADTQWYVPITYTSSNDPTNFENTKTQVWLSPGETATLTALAAADWLVLNNQQVGYYRVDYDDALLQKISVVLASDIETIDEMSRAQIVDDLFNLARAGKKTYKQVFDFLAFLTNENSYYTWYAAFNGFDYILSKTGNEAIRGAIGKLVYDHMKNLRDSVPLDQRNRGDQLYSLKQVLAAKWECLFGDETCLNVTTSSFEAYKGAPDTTLNAELKSVIYCTALKNSKAGSNDFRFLFGRYQQTDLSTEQVTILKALGCVNDNNTREHYLSMVFTEPDIRPQDASNVFSSVYANNVEGATEVIDFISDNYKQILEFFGDERTLNSLLLSVVDYVTDQDQIDKLQKFSEIEDLEESVKTTATKAVAAAKANVEESQQIEEDLTIYFNIQDGGGSGASSYFVNMICLVAGYLLISIY